MDNYSFNKPENNRFVYYVFETFTYNFTENSLYYDTTDNIISSESFTVHSSDYDKMMEYAKQFEFAHGSHWTNYDCPWYEANYARCTQESWTYIDTDGNLQNHVPDTGFMYKIHKVELEFKDFTENNTYTAKWKECPNHVVGDGILTHEHDYSLETPSYHSYDPLKDLNKQNEYAKEKALNS